MESGELCGCKLNAGAERAQKWEIPERTLGTRHSRLPESLGKFVGNKLE